VAQVALPLFICFVVMWRVSSKQTLAGVIGPLIEVPVLVALVYLCLLLRPNFKK
jgi:ACR3 family arsenite transporter